MTAAVGAEAGKIGGQIRRRREASRRCEQLGDGRQDVLDPQPRSIGSVDVRVIPRSLEIDDGAQGYLVRPILERLDVRKMRSPTLRDRWLVPASETERVLDGLQAHGWQVNYTL